MIKYIIWMIGFIPITAWHILWIEFEYWKKALRLINMYKNSNRIEKLMKQYKLRISHNYDGWRIYLVAPNGIEMPVGRHYKHKCTATKVAKSLRAGLIKGPLEMEVVR